LIHTYKCKVRARAALIEDGMSEEEAHLAVEPPLKDGVEDESGFSDDDDDENNNPFKLKKCSIRLQKLWYIEQAIELGCSTVWIPPKGSNRNHFKPKLVW